MKPHPYHPDLYVTEDGEVWLKLAASPSSGGYHTVKVKNGQTVRRHTLVLETYKGLGNGRIARHKDGNPANDHVDNLEWGTQAENMQDAVAHGTFQKGVLARAKLKAEQVSEIKQRLKAGESMTSLASEFQVTVPTIYDIANGRTWGWLAAAS